MSSSESSNPAEKICGRCGQKLPPKAMLVTIVDGKPICLACQIQLAQERGIRH